MNLEHAGPETYSRFFIGGLMAKISEEHHKGQVERIEGYDLLGGKYSGEGINGKPCG